MREKKQELNNGLGFIVESPDILLSYKGEKIPGQTEITVSQPNIRGIRKVIVTFEVQADLPI